MSTTYTVVDPTDPDINARPVRRDIDVVNSTTFTLDQLDAQIAQCESNIAVWNTKQAELQAIRDLVYEALIA